MTQNNTHEQILDTLGDASISHAVYSRRDVLKKSGMGVAALALSGMPIGLAVLTNDALAQSTGTPNDALALALKLEYLEYEYYRRGYLLYNLTNGTSTGTKFTAAEDAVIKTIRDHELAHVNFLRTALGVTSAFTTNFDFTGGSGNGNGPFASVTNTTVTSGTTTTTVTANKTDFMKLAQLFEDFGVRAYKGQLANLISDKAKLTSALQIHSIEARHAAEIRILRNPNAAVGTQTAYTANLNPFITNASFDTGFTATPVAVSGKSQADLATAVYGPATPAVAGVQAPSKGEDNLVQATSMTTITLAASAANTESFDEPVDSATVATVGAFFGLA